MAVTGLFILSILLISCTQQEKPKLYTDKISNINTPKLSSDKNGIINKGYIASDGEWIYYCSYHSFVGGIYKMKEDGSGKARLSGDSTDNFVLSDDEYIYYSLPNYGFYKVSTDGKERIKLSNDCATKMQVIGDTIFFININDDFRIYRMGTDGNGKTKLTEDDNLNEMIIVEDWIYYVKRNEDGIQENIYRVKTDGSKKERINNDNSFDIKVSEEWIYYTNVSDDWNFYRIRTDGNLRTKVSEEMSKYYIEEDWVYYDDGKIYRMKIDGTNGKLLGFGHICDIQDEWICSESRTRSESYIIKTDGSANIKLPKIDIGDVTKISIINDWIYYKSYDDIYRKKINTKDLQLDTKLEHLPKLQLAVTSSSNLKEKNIEYKAEFATDGNYETAWVEGVEGNGIGEWIQLTATWGADEGEILDQKGTVLGMAIANGYTKTEKLYYENNRVAKVRLEFSDGTSSDEYLIEGRIGFSSIGLAIPVKTQYIKIIIQDVFEGSKYRDTAISEIIMEGVDNIFYGDFVNCPN